MEHLAATAVVDALGTVTGWSEGAQKLTGHPAEEIVGRPAVRLLAEEIPPGTVEAQTGVVALRHLDGHRVEVVLTACPVLGPAGQPVGFVITADPPEPAGPSMAERAFQQASMSMSVFDTRQHYLRLNDEACKYLGLPEEALLGRYYADSMQESGYDRGFLRHLREVAETGEPVRFETFESPPGRAAQQAWNIQMWPLTDGEGEPTGVALAAFDNSEEYWARRRLALLNEAATRIGTSLDVVRTAEELVELLVPQFADFASVDLLDWVLGTDQQPPAMPRGAFVLRRVAHTSISKGTPEAVVQPGEQDPCPEDCPPARALREGRVVFSEEGEPDLVRWLEERNARSPERSGYRQGVHSMLAVPLRARGTALGVVVAVRRRHPRNFGGDDAAFGEELASRAAVCIDNARRFARERSTALALQHSLLPSGLPAQAAVDVAHRYLPCGSLAGIGGDWFDVIPLSGSRVALVVGDVVGHGIQSSANMGRLRTAVRTLADVDLPPDELLTHLDDLLTHLAADEDDDQAPELTATCLYAVYDPVSRRMSLAAAGHPAPAVLRPGAEAELVQMTAGPPLGVGGLPFESTELELPEGSVIALYTDGLVENRDLDVDRGTREMLQALNTPADSLDTLCDTLVKAPLDEQPSDDVALLLARTRALGADRVATWDVPPDPAHVAIARQAVTGQLAVWGLQEAAYVTELVVSELVTNAIRYGEPPIRLRLIRDRALICEVSDGSSTSPHLRRAHAFDEGGRGLLLVAQLTQRWGSRQTAGGKTIWAEQPLPEE
ncbi:SpoIIE family protein phosphatase [Streptomyces sp. NPDC006012]|uniref:SpoIIE family protein phosphatase n=1 Tax=Streptomyces sp. NPDC006012 TaxID=3364739 RepID=UPI003696F575